VKIEAGDRLDGCDAAGRFWRTLTWIISSARGTEARASRTAMLMNITQIGQEP
jgi:hypothetical protein